MSCILILQNRVVCARAHYQPQRAHAEERKTFPMRYIKGFFSMRKSRISCKNITEFSHCSLCPTYIQNIWVAGYTQASDFCLLFEFKRADMPPLEVPGGPRRVLSTGLCRQRRASALLGSSSHRASRCLRKMWGREPAGPRTCITSWVEEQQWRPIGLDQGVQEELHRSRSRSSREPPLGCTAELDPPAAGEGLCMEDLYLKARKEEIKRMRHIWM